MNEVKDRVGFLREGLFAKYVVALVGLVVFVLAVNGAIETWITYRGIKSSLNDGMSEKAEATAKRIQQSLSDLERQISWVTRASSDTRDRRRDDYAQLLRQVPQVSQLSLLNAQGREQLRMTRQTVTLDSNADFSRDVRLTETLSRGTSFAPAYLRGERPFTSIALSHADGSITIAEVDLDFLSEFLIDAQVGKVAFAFVTDAKGDVLAASSTGPEVGKNLSKLPQVQAVSKPGGVAPAYQTIVYPCSATRCTCCATSTWVSIAGQATFRSMSKRREAGIYPHEKQSFSSGAPNDVPSSERGPAAPAAQPPRAETVRGYAR
jgi:hypothetical protein